MIGYRDQSTVRRPIYSDTGAKLYYVVSGPDGEWLTTVDGKKIGRIKRVRNTRARDIATTVSGGATVGSEETWEY